MWYQLQIESCLPNEVDPLSDALEESGALSITLTDKNDNPVLEPEPGTTPLWPDVIMNALYRDKWSAEAAKLNLVLKYPHLVFSIHEIVDKDWERVWMDEFQPMCFGKRLWICPTWIKPPEPHAVNLILDPGLAFGTGTHPTTSLCLSWLDEANLDHKTIIDFGCGSGVLSLAALKLGASQAFAVDIDEQALEATKNNAETNRINLEQLTIGRPDSLQERSDILIANILLAPLLDLQTQFRNLLNDKGTLVISGLLDEQAEELIEAYQTHFKYQSTQNLGGWSLLIFLAG